MILAASCRTQSAERRAARRPRSQTDKVVREKHRKKSCGNEKKKEEEEEVERTHRLLSLRELRAVHLPVPL
jgi:hypothetical protein